MKRVGSLVSVLSSVVLGLAGCGDDDGEPNLDGGADAAAFDGGATNDATGECGDGGVAIPPAMQSASCQPLATDYTPRIMSSSADSWPACISDDGSYHQLGASISTIARIAAFEQIATLLFGGGAPSPQAFLDARVIYTQDNGLESRVSRREDEHYPAAPMACGNLAMADLLAHADRCAGPAKIQPLLNAAFLSGARGEAPARSAARIEAGLLWFLLISVHKEARTCAAAPADCDSSYAYYTGGDDRSGGKGLSRYVRAEGAAGIGAHDRIFDGNLAVRCWRDLDNPTGAAMDLVMRDRAVAQVNRALHRGVALVVRSRAARMAQSCGAAADVDFEVVKILGGALLREAAVRDALAHAVVAREIGRGSTTEVNVPALVLALDRAFDCP